MINDPRAESNRLSLPWQDTQGTTRHALSIDVDAGLLREARHCPSPNWDARTIRGVGDLIVIHNISLPPKVFGGPSIDALFQNRLDPRAHAYFATIADLRVSSHLLIRRDGEIVQYVPFHRRAWHAGLSCFQGRERCNDFSIGIELEGADDIAYTSAQYEHLSAVIHTLCGAYPTLDPARIVGHSDIAPGRKSDPGPAFDWQRLQHALAAPARDDDNDNDNDAPTTGAPLMSTAHPIIVFRGNVLPEWIDFNGHMNVAYYMLAFDQGTDGFLDIIGMDAAYRERTGLSVFTLETQIKYLQELKEGDPLSADLQLLDHNGKLMHYFMRLHHAEAGYLAATCELMLLSVDLRERKSRPLDAPIRAKVDALLDEHRALERPALAGTPIGIRR